MENTKDQRTPDEQDRRNRKCVKKRTQTLEPAQAKLEHESLKLFVNGSPLRTRYILEEFPSRINIALTQE